MYFLRENQDKFLTEFILRNIPEEQNKKRAYYEVYISDLHYKFL